MKRKTILTFLLIFFVFISYYIYKVEDKKLNKDISNKTKEQYYIVKEYFELQKAYALTFKNSFINHLTINRNIDLPHPYFFKYKQLNNSFYVSHKLDDITNTKAVINGIGKIETLNRSQLKEINTVLNLSPIFKTALESLPTIDWIYYSSANKFIYLAPTNMAMSDIFIKEQYKKQFWEQAIPKNNPSHNFILTDLYKDGAGKGLMSTLSLPILFEKKFKGIISIDISYKSLKEILLSKIDGDFYLINQANNIISSTKKDIIIKDFDIDNIKNISNETRVFKILDEKIKLIYSISKIEKRFIIFKNSIFKILLLLFILFIIYLLIYLNILNQKIKKLAHTDPLTSLLNRRAVTDYCNEKLEMCHDQYINTSLLLLDIDDFKIINDKYGHNIGDLVLKEVAKVLKNTSRRSDIISRYGGEEFLIILEETNLKFAFTLAERIRKEINKIQIMNYEFKITISIGCVSFNDKDKKFEDLVNRADKLLYLAKEKGKNQTQF